MDKDTLSDINLKMTLSSRVVLIGANGAGKNIKYIQALC